jgi:Linalool dehydratase/isomerase
MEASLKVEDVALDRMQIGHLRRMFNLSAQLPDDWSGMMGKTSLQEDFSGYRFQLAFMAYAMALTHVHRLPAAPGYFRRPMQRLIEKMRSPDVWTYWHYVSTGNGPFNKAQGVLPAEWNPIVKDNIMYSAYLQSMALLYHHMFDDDRYARPGALSLQLQPLYWGEHLHFDFDEKSINEHLYWNMVERGYLGIACEPNCVFQICNQIPIHGFRFHDIVYGGSTAEEVTAGYLDAWSKFGVLNDNGHFNMMVMEEEQVVITPEAPWSDFWLGAMMHAWNPDVVKESFPAQIARWSRPGPDNTLWIAPPDAIPGAPELPSARDFGWAAACASEVGDTETRDKLLAYADRFLHARWSNGGYHYARHDTMYDEEGLFRAMDPHTGNALLGYARLNVPGGLHKLYTDPWGAAHHREPALDDLPEDVDVSAARFLREESRLEIALERAETKEADFLFANVWGRGKWSLHLDGEAVANGDADAVSSSSEAITVSRQGDRLALHVPKAASLKIAIQWR